jgi:pimeloyl-ACP methyl ester carboxylesterase
MSNFVVVCQEERDMAKQHGLLGGVTRGIVDTSRLRTHVLMRGLIKDSEPVLFIHGNVSSSRFFEETLATLPLAYRGIAPDLRGFGESETKPLDATRGLRDFSDDLHALVTTLKLAQDRKIHLVGWSMGGGMVMQYTIDHPDEVASVTLINPIPPYGIGGTKGANGTPIWNDYAGGGGRLVEEFIYRLRNCDRTAESLASPRNVMNLSYFRPPFRAAAEREEVLLSALLSTKVGVENYPGYRPISKNWPHVAPGPLPGAEDKAYGIVNAISPKYCKLDGFATISPKPNVLWIRGANDLIVSNKSPLDFAELGRLGRLPDWPGEKVYPPQPMISQTRAVLDSYQAEGGEYQEVEIDDCAHSPQIEKPEHFRRALFGFLDQLPRPKPKPAEELRQIVSRVGTI